VAVTAEDHTALLRGDSACFLDDPPGPSPTTGGCACLSGSLTCEEEEILGQMIELKQEVRSVQRRIAAIETDLDPALFSQLAEAREASARLRLMGEVERYEEWKFLTRRLQRLRETFKRWEQKRDDASHRKMVLLGHVAG